MQDVLLPPDLERFASDAVASGRYRNRSELLAASLGLLQQLERERADLLASVLSAEAEAGRDGCLTGEEVAARVRRTIARRTAAPA